MDKSPEAFRTISEVAETLETPAHVLRFWESRFPQIRPVKRAGGRRYYRPADVALLSGIRHLLHDEGMTIRGVQKILREQGVRHVAALAVGGEAVAFDGDGPAEDGLEEVGLKDGRPGRAEEPMGEVVQLRAPPVASEPPALAAPPVTDAAADMVPEAGHVWVEDEPELALRAPLILFAPERPKVFAVPAAAEPPAVFAVPVADAPFMDQAPEPLAKLSGVAARLRALPRPTAPGALSELMELHSRLGLLHAQMAEALRQRR